MTATASTVGPGGHRLALFGAAVLFSTGGVGIKWLSFDPWQVAALRGLAAALAVYFIVPGPVARPSRGVLLVAAAQGATMLLFVLANRATTAANTIFLQSTAPLWVPLLAFPLLGERVKRRDLLSMVAIAVGLSLFFVGSDDATATAPSPALGNVLAVASGATWAATVVGLRALSAGGLASSGTAKAALVWGNLMVAAVALPVAWPLAAGTATDWAVVALLGGAQVALAYRLLARGLAGVPALEASLLLMFEPVLNPVWAFALLGERPSAWALAGAAVLATATITRAAVEGRRRGRGGIPAPGEPPPGA